LYLNVFLFYQIEIKLSTHSAIVLLFLQDLERLAD